MPKVQTNGNCQNDFDELDELVKIINSTKPDERFKDLEYLFKIGKKLKPLKKIWDAFVFEGGLIHFPSERGIGKTLLLLNLAISIANGEKAFIDFNIDYSGPVLFLDFEMGERLMTVRLNKMLENTPFELKSALTNLFVLNTNRTFIEELPKVLQLITEIKPILIIVDNLRLAVSSINANSGSEIARFFQLILSIRSRYNTAIIVVDHFRKHTKNLPTESDLQSGSGVKTDLSDGDFVLRQSAKNKNFKLLRRIKSRMFEQSSESILIKLNPETLWFELEERNACESDHIGLSSQKETAEFIDTALQLNQEGLSNREIADIIGKSKSTVNRWLNNKLNSKSN